MALGTAIAILLACPSARADFYRWTDAEGVTHYTEDLDRVPRRYRSSLEVVRPQLEPARGALPELEVERDPRPVDAGLPELAPAEPAPAPEAGRAPTPGELPPELPRAGAGPPAIEPAPPGMDPRRLEIAELERELGARREELKNLISQSSFDNSRVATDPRLRELAEILPRLQAELEALRGELEP